MGTDAVMGSVAEAQVPAGAAHEVEFVRALELTLVAIGGLNETEDPLPATQLDAPHLDGFGCGAPHVLEHPLVPQHFLEGGLGEARIRGEYCALLRRQGELAQISGKLAWPRASLTQPFDAVLGNYDVKLRTGERGHRAELRGKGGVLDADGDVRLQNNGRFVAEIRLRPTRNAPRDLVDSLRLFSRRQRDGSYLIKQAGRLRDFL